MRHFPKIIVAASDWNFSPITKVGQRLTIVILDGQGIEVGERLEPTNQKGLIFECIGIDRYTNTKNFLRLVVAEASPKIFERKIQRFHANCRFRVVN